MIVVSFGLAAPASGAALQCDAGKYPDPASCFFGSRLSASGDYAIAGMRYDSDGWCGVGIGLTILRRDADAWVLDDKIFAPGNGQFGASVAIDGERVLIGCPQDPSPGRAYVYRRDDGGTPAQTSDDRWVQEAVLQPTVPSPSVGMMGWTVALEGDWAVVGTKWSPPTYVFRRVDNGTPSDPADDTWVQHAELDVVGHSVDMDGDRIVVGGIANGPACISYDRIFVYRREDGGTPVLADDAWVAEATQPASLPVTYFGDIVSMDGDFVAVGQYGDVYVFRRDDAGTPSEPGDDVWVQHAKLPPSSVSASSEFCSYLCLAGDRLLVGAPAVTWGDGLGKVLVYHREANGTPNDVADDVWTLRGELAAFDGAPGDEFGSSVALTGDTALVGAPDTSPPGIYDFDLSSLCSDTTSVSLSTGGTQALRLDAGPTAAGELYLVLGSTAPGAGVSVDDVVLPLTVDAYLLYTLANPNTAAHDATLGVLDAAGKAYAAVNVPPGLSPALAGLALVHAFLSFDAGPSATFASDALPLLLAP